ncbi:DUF484 family protein [Aliikangiella sp. IMCC44359]|uniref:DUF484 family protein n=1 Tax=Aliikangiella sp. IMCC44359 TaxID=3459125 RepID=UPI00403B05EA
MKFSNSQALEEGKISRLNQLMEEAQVKNYLANNPDFLLKNPQLLTHMELNHGCEAATSLVERQIKVLRERNQTMQGQLIEMLHAAHNNEKLLIQCNHFMLELLQAKDLKSLCFNIRALLKKDFNIDDAALVLVGNYHQAEPAQVYDDASEIRALLKCQFPDSQPLCGRLEMEPKKALFGELSKNLESFALIPLGEECKHGLLALASSDVSRFAPEMGTLFIELIANLVTHLTKSYESS